MIRDQLRFSPGPALGEALAHLEYLVPAGRIERRLGDGRVRYVSAAAVG